MYDEFDLNEAKEVVSHLIEETPTIQKMKADMVIQKHIDEMKKDMPDTDIKTVDDLVKHADYELICEHLAKGKTLKTAYKDVKSEKFEKEFKTIDPEEFKIAKMLNPKLTKEDYLKYKKGKR